MSTESSDMTAKMERMYTECAV